MAVMLLPGQHNMKYDVTPFLILLVNVTYDTQSHLSCALTQLLSADVGYVPVLIDMLHNNTRVPHMAVMLLPGQHNMKYDVTPFLILLVNVTYDTQSHLSCSLTQFVYLLDVQVMFLY
ncbi:hypothetical protein J6590_085287 [Homalodisca vitripennis]|nr:hypothetical protein J6590_085287 [Homalodisca vitripennis]